MCTLRKKLNSNVKTMNFINRSSFDQRQRQTSSKLDSTQKYSSGTGNFISFCQSNSIVWKKTSKQRSTGIRIIQSKLNKNKNATNLGTNNKTLCIWMRLCVNCDSKKKILSKFHQIVFCFLFNLSNIYSLFMRLKIINDKNIYTVCRFECPRRDFVKYLEKICCDTIDKQIYTDILYFVCLFCDYFLVLFCQNIPSSTVSVTTHGHSFVLVLH